MHECFEGFQSFTVDSRRFLEFILGIFVRVRAPAFGGVTRAFHGLGGSQGCITREPKGFGDFWRHFGRFRVFPAGFKGLTEMFLHYRGLAGISRGFRG